MVREFKTFDAFHKLVDIVNEVPQPISIRTFNSLKRAGFIYLEELSYVRDVDIIKIRNLGRRSFDELKDLMDTYNVSFSNINVLEEHLDKFKVGERVKYIGGDYILQNIIYPVINHYRNPYVFLDPVYDSYKSIEIYHPYEILLIHKFS